MHSYFFGMLRLICRVLIILLYKSQSGPGSRPCAKLTANGCYSYSSQTSAKHQVAKEPIDINNKYTYTETKVIAV